MVSWQHYCIFGRFTEARLCNGSLVPLCCSLVGNTINALGAFLQERTKEFDNGDGKIFDLSPELALQIRLSSTFSESSKKDRSTDGNHGICFAMPLEVSGLNTVLIALYFGSNSYCAFHFKPFIHEFEYFCRNNLVCDLISGAFNFGSDEPVVSASSATEAELQEVRMLMSQGGTNAINNQKQTSLFSIRDQKTSKELADYFSQWPHNTFFIVPRVCTFIGRFLPSFLYAVLSGFAFCILGIEKDIFVTKRLLEMISSEEQFSVTLITEMPTTFAPETVYLDFGKEFTMVGTLKENNYTREKSKIINSFLPISYASTDIVSFVETLKRIEQERTVALGGIVTTLRDAVNDYTLLFRILHVLRNSNIASFLRRRFVQNLEKMRQETDESKRTEEETIREISEIILEHIDRESFKTF